MARSDDLDGVTVRNVGARPLRVADRWAVSLLMTDGTSEWEVPDIPVFETREQAEEHIALHPELYGTPENDTRTPA